MSLKGIILELRGMREGIGIISKRGEGKHWSCRTRSHTVIAPDQSSSFTQFDQQSPPPIHFYQQSSSSNLPPELLLDIIRRVEESETTWPARAVVLFCASVCRFWREITKGIVKTPEQCGMLTFPISLKQPGPREAPIQCFLKRDRVTSTYFLYFGLVPSEGGRDKLLLAARRFRRTTCTEFVISLAADDFSRDSNTCVGRLRSNFLGTKFSIYDNQPICDAAVQINNRSSRKYHSKQVCPRVPTCNYNVASIEYELNVIRTRGPRKLQCWIHSIPFFSILESGTVPTPMSPHSHFFTEQLSSPPNSKGYESSTNLSSTSSPDSSISVQGTKKPLHLKNKAPRWHEQLQCWCLNFKGRVTVASVKNFQLVATPDPSDNVPEEILERVILQFGKIGKDIFTMDYHYPLSAFQAFAICLSSFDTKPACE